MDNVTLLGIISSVITIISFFLSKFVTTYKNTSFSHNNISIDMSSNINQSLNINSNNRVTNTYIFPTKNSSDYTNEKDIFDIILFLIGLTIILGYKYFLLYKDKMMLLLTLLVLICMSINLICTILLLRRRLIHKRNFNFYILQWLPLFIMIISFYHPFFHSTNINRVETMLKNGSGLLTVAVSYSNEFSFLFIQMFCLIIIAFSSVLWLKRILVQTYKGLRYKSIAKELSFKDISIDVAILIFIFLIISGEYLNLMNLYIEKIRLIHS